MKKILIITLFSVLFCALQLSADTSDLANKLEVGHNLNKGIIAIYDSGFEIYLSPNFYFYLDDQISFKITPGALLNHRTSENTAPLSQSKINLYLYTGPAFNLPVTEKVLFSPGFDLYISNFTDSVTSEGETRTYTSTTAGIEPGITARYFIMENITLLCKAYYNYRFYSSSEATYQNDPGKNTNSLLLFPEPNKRLNFSFGLSFFL